MRKQILFYLDNKVIKACNPENGYCSLTSYDDIPEVGKQINIGDRIYKVKDINVGKSIYVSLKVDIDNLGKITNNSKANLRKLYFD